MDGLGGAHAPAGHTPPNVCLGKAALPLPTSPSGQLFVTIPSHGIDKWGPISWRPNGSRLPAEGDECLIAFDERGMPWLVEWTATTSFAPPLVNALPSAPYDGQEIAFQNAAMATAGIVWRFRYRAASGSAYKWEMIGGVALFSEFAALTEISSTTYVGVAEASPSIALPLAGDYDVVIGAKAYGAAAGAEGKVSYKIGATPAADEDSLDQYLGGAAISVANPTGNIVRPRRKLNLAAVTLQQQYRTPSGATINFTDRWMSALPVRVG